MEIRTSEHIRNVSYSLRTQKDNKFHKKKWVAVDDILPIIKKLHFDFSYKENIRINSKNSQDLDKAFYKLEKQLKRQ